MEWIEQDIEEIASVYPETSRLQLLSADPFVLDFDRLNESWESNLIKDIGDIGDSESWASKYNDKSQKDLRKKYKIQTFDEIKEFDQMMHDAHIY